MNRIAISITMILPPLFLLSLAVAQPVSAAPPNRAAAVAAPWGPGAIASPDGVRPNASEVVFGECTGSACSAPRPGGGLTHVPDPLRLASLVVDVEPDVLRVNVAPDALHVNVAPDALHVDLAPDALHVNVAPDALHVDSAQTPISGEATVPLPTDIARGAETGSANSLPRVVSDLLSRLLDLVRQVPLPMPR